MNLPEPVRNASLSDKTEIPLNIAWQIAGGFFWRTSVLTPVGLDLEIQIIALTRYYS